MHRITGRPIHEEASDGRSFDLVRWIRTRRAQWLGHILRMHPARMLYRVVRYIHGSRKKGDLLMDAPDYSWEQLVRLAQNRDAWRSMVKSIRSKQHTSSRWVYQSGGSGSNPRETKDPLLHPQHSRSQWLNPSQVCQRWRSTRTVTSMKPSSDPV